MQGILGHRPWADVSENTRDDWSLILLGPMWLPLQIGLHSVQLLLQIGALRTNENREFCYRYDLKQIASPSQAKSHSCSRSFVSYAVFLCLPYELHFYLQKQKNTHIHNIPHMMQIHHQYLPQLKKFHSVVSCCCMQWPILKMQAQKSRVPSKPEGKGNSILKKNWMPLVSIANIC